MDPDNRAARKARRDKHAQRTPFTDKALGNPAAEVIKAELARMKKEKT